MQRATDTPPPAGHTVTEMPRPASRARFTAFLLLGLAVAGGAAAFGIAPRLKQRAALAEVQHDLGQARLVRVAKVEAGALKTELTVPGTAVPFRSTVLFAKSSGFLRRNAVDVGDAVKTGQLLAEIDAPETDEDLRLAQARLEEAEANVQIVKATADRNKALAAEGVVSQQAAEDARAQANSSIASVKSRQADLQRLRAMRGYQSVVAPFDGVVTRRNVDPGALVGPAGAASQPLFEIAQVAPMRIFLDVPQSVARGITVGLEASVYLPSLPNQAVTGRIVRTSTVLDQATRTLRTEVQIPPDGPILPGAFVYVKISVPRHDAPAVITANALIVRKEGTLVARVEQGRVKMVPVLVTRDLGKELEIESGLAANDLLVVNAPDDLVDGTLVQIAPEKRDGG